MRLLSVFILTLLAAVVTSCSIDDVIDNSNDGSLKFSAVQEMAFTRGTPVDMAANIPSMVVYAYYTGNGTTADKKWSATSTPNWLNGATVTNSGVGTGTPSWSYPNPVYWPRETNANMSFFGFSPAPVTGTAGNGITVTNTTGTPTLHYATPRVATYQPDLLVSTPHKDLYPAGNSTITFGMKHALTCVGFKVAAANDNFDLTGITVVGINSEGDLSTDGTNVAWTNVTTPDSAAVGLASSPYPVTAASTNCTATNGYLLMIPQTLTSTAKLKIYISGAAKTLEVPLNGYIWEAGKKIIYTMTISKDMNVDIQVGEQPWDDPINADGNLGAGQLPWASSMAFTIKTTTAGETFSVPFSGTNGTGTVTVDWGDGSTSTIAPNASGSLPAHPYATAGNHTIRISTTQTDTQTKQIPALSFNGYTQLVSMNTPMLNTGATDFSLCFYNCSKLANIPADLFKYNTQVTNFTQILGKCLGLSSIPADLFKYNTKAISFIQIFRDCTGLTGSIPADLFKYNTLATDFQSCFKGCSGLTGSIPADLFKYNTAVTSVSYSFVDCTGLTGSIPTNLFQYNTKIVNLEGTFQNCLSLTGSIPADLFKYNTAATNFRLCFDGCTKLSLNANVFCNDASATERTTRFAGKTVDFSSCFYNCNGGGTAPQLWNYTYGSVPSSTTCFGNVTAVTNVAAIPAGWK